MYCCIYRIVYVHNYCVLMNEITYIPVGAILATTNKRLSDGTGSVVSLSDVLPGMTGCAMSQGLIIKAVLQQHY